MVTYFNVGEKVTHYNAKPMCINIEPSYRLLVLLLVISSIISLVILVLPIFWWEKGMAFVMIAGSAWYSIAKHALLRFDSSWQQIEVNNKGELYVADKNGKVAQANILPSSFVASYLIVLNLKLAESMFPQHLLLLPDSAKSEDLRRLRVWLRWGMPNANGVNNLSQDA